MKRAATLLTWWYLAVGGALTAASFSASDHRVRLVMYAVSVALFLAAVCVAWRRTDVPSRLALLSALAGLGFATSRLVPGGAVAATNLVSVVAGLGAYGIAGVALVMLLRLRGPQATAGLAGDALIVALGVWLISWTAVVQPIDEAHGTTLATALHALQLPMAAVVLFLTMSLLLDDSRRPVSLWLLAGGLTFQVLADLVDDLMDAGHVTGGFERVAVPLAIAAAMCAGGTYLHPSVRDLARSGAADAPRPLGRLVVTIGSLAFPVIVLAGSSATGTVDKVVRSISAITLAAVVTVRVIQTVRATSQTQAALIHVSQIDPLTGLPNRSVLLQQITDLLGISWTQEQFPSLFFVDLDRFKNINDSLGHGAGDEVLVIVAERLRNAVPEGATVARISGDEYVILDPNPTSPAAAMTLAEQLLVLFREPLALSHGDVFITASIGVAAISATSSTSPEDLVRHADTAMYRAKDAGRNCIAVYDASMHERVAHRLAVETALYRALDRRELRLYHQPIYDLRSKEVVGFEALMRWQQSDGTIVSPAEFIPIAEDNGTIVPIGAWALLEALTQLRHWIDDGVCNPSATMSVNVSPVQLADPNFPGIVSEALTRSGVPPQLVWLEVTEGVMITEPELALATLRRLGSIGVRIALDDFGTGYSSLSLLQKFPLQRIKIDRAFVRGVAENPNDRSLVRTIIIMARSLGMEIVAEGVESMHQLQVLIDLECEKAQGFLISHPVPADAMRSTVAALERLDQFTGLRPSTTQFN